MWDETSVLESEKTEGCLASAYAVNFSGLMLVVFEGFSLDWLSSRLVLMILPSFSGM